LFKLLATLRTDAKLFADVEELRWRGPTDAFAAWTERVGAPKLLQRCIEAPRKAAGPGTALKGWPTERPTLKAGR
jgi:hypothetical protein